MMRKFLTQLAIGLVSKIAVTLLWSLLQSVPAPVVPDLPQPMYVQAIVIVQAQA